jgi:hypothetical protein
MNNLAPGIRLEKLCKGNTDISGNLTFNSTNEGTAVYPFIKKRLASNSIINTGIRLGKINRTYNNGNDKTTECIQEIRTKLN